MMQKYIEIFGCMKSFMNLCIYIGNTLISKRI